MTFSDHDPGGPHPLYRTGPLVGARGPGAGGAHRSGPADAGATAEYRTIADGTATGADRDGYSPPPAPPPPVTDLEPLPPPRRRRGLVRWRRSLWLRYGVGVAVLLAVVLVLAGLALRPSRMASGRSGRQVGAAGGGGGGGPTMDGTAGPSLSVSTGGAPVASVYEAEDTAHNTLGPGTEVRAVPGTSDGKVVSHIGHGTPAGDLTFNDVTAQAPGTEALTIYYLLADTAARRLALWVNGKGPTVLNFPPLGARTPATVGVLHVTVTLKAGANAIRFSNATAKYGPDLDRITLAPQ